MEEVREMDHERVRGGGNPVGYDSLSFEIMGDAGQVKDMLAAWSKYLGEVTNPKSDRDNPFYHSKYAPLDNVLDEIRPKLAKHGLVMWQIPTSSEQVENGKPRVTVSIKTVVAHEGGGMMVFPEISGQPKDGSPQAVGSVVTYLRRYSLSAILGIVGTDEDDDGALASNTKVASAPKNEFAAAHRACMAMIAEKEKIFKRGAPEIMDVIQSVAGCKLGEIKDVNTMKAVTEALSKLSK